jgi:hypothetical protein
METPNSLTFESTDGTKRLSVSFLAGRLTYETRNPHYGPTNLTRGVPPMSEMPHLAADFVRKIGISLYDITNPYDNGQKIEGGTRFHFSEPGITYFVNGVSLHNTEYRTAKFWRCVDGFAVIGGDGGEVSFGEHGTIRRFSVTWRTLNRYQRLPTVNMDTAAKLVRTGNAMEELIPGQIDWAKVQSLTVKKASPLYYNGHSEWLWPFLGLVAVTEPNFGLTQFGIDCPIIDETKVRKR